MSHPLLCRSRAIKCGLLFKGQEEIDGREDLENMVEGLSVSFHLRQFHASDTGNNDCLGL